MIVLDASVVVDLLLSREPHGAAVAELLVEHAPAIAVPHLLDVEVASALRGYVIRGELPPARAKAALEDLADLPATRYEHTPLIPRALQLRDNLTVYDAIYLVLAEATAATLVTRDAAFADIPGARARVRLLRGEQGSKAPE